NYYLNNTFQGRATSFQLAWIGSLTMLALDIFGPITGAICVYFGFRKSGFAGVVIMTISLVAAAYATEIWQLYLTQGILYGFGGSLTYFSTLSLPSQWFRRNRGLATGIIISGGGIGGIWLSPLISKLLESKGLRCTMMCCAIAHFVILTPLVMLFKSLSKDSEKKHKFIDFTVLKEVRFCLLFVAGIFVISGYFVPFFYINSYAIQHGVDASSAALMVGLMNGSSAIGRVIMGMVSDIIGPINALFISTLAATLSLLLIWTFAKTAAMMFVFSVVYGFCCGTYPSSTVSVTGAICGPEKLAVVTGIIFAGMAIGSGVGAPIAGAILDTVGHKTDYMGVIIFAGAVMSLGTVILFFLKFKTNKNMFSRV
ncbi:MAG: major facilitator superfamily domain-containing protein, partial [Podila humilis]